MTDAPPRPSRTSRARAALIGFAAVAGPLAPPMVWVLSYGAPASGTSSPPGVIPETILMGLPCAASYGLLVGVPAGLIARAIASRSR